MPVGFLMMALGAVLNGNELIYYLGLGILVVGIFTVVCLGCIYRY